MRNITDLDEIEKDSIKEHVKSESHYDQTLNLTLKVKFIAPKNDHFI